MTRRSRRYSLARTCIAVDFGPCFVRMKKRRRTFGEPLRSGMAIRIQPQTWRIGRSNVAQAYFGQRRLEAAGARACGRARSGCANGPRASSGA